MDDDIKLPPLLGFEAVAHWQAVRDYARAAVLADRERRAEQARPAKPQVHKARLSLADNGDWSVGGDHRPGRINILIRWTDGRVWIESERNRELARRLRIILPRLYASAPDLAAAADALCWEPK